MKVQIWSDIVCPFCYIGKRRYEAALERFEHKHEVKMEFKSYQLDPSATKGVSENIHQRLATKYGVPYEQGKAMNDQMAQQAKEVGLDYQFDTMIPTNTEDAHRLSHYAKEQGKMEEMMERLMKAYFTESLDVGDQDTLANLAAEVGLDKEKAQTILSEGKYRAEVINDQEEGAELGIDRKSVV